MNAHARATVDIVIKRCVPHGSVVLVALARNSFIGALSSSSVAPPAASTSTKFRCVTWWARCAGISLHSPPPPPPRGVADRLWVLPSGSFPRVDRPALLFTSLSVALSVRYFGVAL